MTDPNPSGSGSGSTRAPPIAPSPASPSSVSAARMPPPRPRPQPAPMASELSHLPPRQRSTSAASTSSARQQPVQQQQQQQSPAQQHQVRRQPSRDGGASISSQQAQGGPTQRPTSSASVRPSSVHSGRPPFAPLYTVVSNATSDTAYHPRVHYIFSDDDENEALAQALHHAAHRQQQYNNHHRGNSGGGSLRPPFPNTSRSISGSEDSLAHGNRDRAILLDLAPTVEGGWEVAQASSLSADWAVVSTQVSRLQDGGDDSPHDDDGPQSLMLRIEGVDGPGHAHSGRVGEVANLEGSRGSAGRASSSHAPEYGAMIDEFEKKMGVLRQVIEAGDEKGKGPEASGRAELGVVEEESTEGER